MRTRPLGQTGLSVSELALGTWGLSGEAYGPVTEADKQRVVDRAHALGITLFETADSYGRGAMERMLGTRLPADSTYVVTKIGTDRDSTPPRKRFDAPYLRAAFDRSRERLRRDKVDVLLLHNPALETVERGDATGVLGELKTTGAIRAWGVSAGSVEVARAAIAQGADVLSLAYNVFFSTDVHELHDDLERSGTGLLAHSVLAHGLLCGFWSAQRQFSAHDHRNERWTFDELRQRLHQLQALRVLVGGTVHTMRAAALRFVLANDDMSAAIIGPRNSVQLDQLVREAGKGPPYLPEDKLEQLAARLDALGVPS
jgi:aryl-alcohol dehydrogenase-like predicted oxidoreductase